MASTGIEAEPAEVELPEVELPEVEPTEVEAPAFSKGIASASPIADMLTERGRRSGQPGIRSGRCQPVTSTGNQPEDDNNMPPAASRQAPVSAGKAAIARTASAPPRARCTP